MQMSLSLVLDSKLYLENKINTAKQSITMTKSISCSDAGSDCGWSATAETEDELMGKVAEHAKAEHKDLEINPELAAKIKSLIKEI
jgi:predicted small metal-binding protein